MTDNLLVSIRNVYNTFRHYPLRQKIDGCPCCVSGEDQATIHNKPLQQLTSEDLRRYTFKAMTTWGDLDDFKHFLPRMLELLVWEEDVIDRNVVFNKLLNADWEKWPEKEAVSVRNFLVNFWTVQIQTKPYADVAMFVSFYEVIGKIEILLDRWKVGFDDLSFSNLITFINRCVPDLVNKKGAYKTFDNATIEKLRSWLFLKSEIVEEGFFKYEGQNPLFASHISEASQLLLALK